MLRMWNVGVLDVGVLDVECWVCNVGCWVWNVGCWMWSVGCEMMDVECGIGNGACGTGMFSHGSQLDTETMRAAFIKNTDFPMRTDGSFHGFFTLAPLPTAWFLMRRRRNGSTRNFSQAESCVGECHTMGLLGMRKIWKSARSVGDN